MPPVGKGCGGGGKSCLAGMEPAGACQHMAAAFFFLLPSNFLFQLTTDTHAHTQLHGGSYPSDSIRSPPPLSVEPCLTITSSFLITSAKTFLWRPQLRVQTLQTVLWHKSLVCVAAPTRFGAEEVERRRPQSLPATLWAVKGGGLVALEGVNVDAVEMFHW